MFFSAESGRTAADDRLIEMDYGPYEGMDLENLPPEIAAFFSDFVNNPAPEEMEQLSAVVQRTVAFLEDIYGQKIVKKI